MSILTSAGYRRGWYSYLVSVPGSCLLRTNSFVDNCMIYKVDCSGFPEVADPEHCFVTVQGSSLRRVKVVLAPCLQTVMLVPDATMVSKTYSLRVPVIEAALIPMGSNHVGQELFSLDYRQVTDLRPTDNFLLYVNEENRALCRVQARLCAVPPRLPLRGQDYQPANNEQGPVSKKRRTE